MSISIDPLSRASPSHYNLLTLSDPERTIKRRHVVWYCFQAAINDAYHSDLPEHHRAAIQQKLAFMILRGMVVVSPHIKETVKLLDKQISPIFYPFGTYFRFRSQKICGKIIAEELGIPHKHLFVVYSPLIKEVLSRSFPSPFQILPIKNWNDFDSVCLIITSKLQRSVAIGARQNRETLIAIDFSECISSLEPLSVQLDQLRERVRNLRISSKIQPYALINYNGNTILIFPFLYFSKKSTSIVEESFRQLILVFNGYVLSPDQHAEFLLKYHSYQSILSQANVPLTVLSLKSTPMPTVCSSFSEFMAQPVVKKFRALSEISQVPYLQIIPEATFHLLNGFVYRNVDDCFVELGLTPTLQMLFFTLLNGLQKALHVKDDMVAFMNEMEFIHQQMMNLLAVLSIDEKYAYGPGDLERAIINRLTSGERPTIPPEYSELRVHFKPSATHSFSSVLSSIEAEKGSNQLSIALHAQSYFEIKNLLLRIPTYTVYPIKRDLSKVINPIDLLVTLFHSNVTAAKVYQPIPLLHQVLELIQSGLLAEKCTIVIDTTVGLDESEELRSFLLNRTIQRRICSGKLCVVLLRSAQKFDMFGMDNYYGGLTVTISHKEHFPLFHRRMDHPEDQLYGLCYQGMAHIHTCAGFQIDRYRKAIISNTQKLYSYLPHELFYSKRNFYPMQIALIDDPLTPFIRLIFCEFRNVQGIVWDGISHFADQKKLPLSFRQGFGFWSSNLSYINAQITRLSVGLEDEKTLFYYGHFFSLLKNYFDNCTQKDQKFSEIDFFQSMNLLIPAIFQYVSVKRKKQFDEMVREIERNKKILPYQIRHPNTGETLLHYAVRSDPLEYDFLHYLLNNCGLIKSINAQDNLGRTALHRALRLNRYGVGRMLVSYGADAHIEERWEFCCNGDEYPSLVLEAYYSNLPAKFKQKLQEVLLYLAAIEESAVNREVSLTSEDLEEEIAGELRISSEYLRVVQNPLIKEVLVRAFPSSVSMQVKTLSELWTHIQRVDLTQLKQPVVVDFSDCFKNAKGLQRAIFEIHSHFQKNRYPVPIQFYALTTYHSHTLLVLPSVNGKKQSSFKFNKLVDQLCRTNGFQLNRNQEIFGMIQYLDELQDLFPNGIKPLSISQVKIPTLFTHFNDFLHQPEVVRFKNFFEKETIGPYQKNIAEFIFLQLQQLSFRSVDHCFAEFNLSPMLQIIYASLLQELHKAVDCQDNFDSFMKIMGRINKKVTFILAILSIEWRYAYCFEDRTLEMILAGKLIGNYGRPPFLPGSIPSLSVEVKASYKLALSSILSAIEAEKRSNQVVVWVPPDSSSDITQLFQSISTYEIVKMGEIRRQVDAFFCQHNQMMSVLEMTRYLNKEGLLAKKWTIVVDVTFQSQESHQVFQFLSEPDIVYLLSVGRLSVVLVRDAERFDTLDMDNFPCGVTVTINDGSHFKQFNERMAYSGDRLNGLSYQRMTHLHASAEHLVDDFREMILSASPVIPKV